MIKIAHVCEVEVLELPHQVKKLVKGVVSILDDCYGEQRLVDASLGGYVLIIQDPEELTQLDEHALDVDAVIPEYVDLISVPETEDWASVLVLLSSDFSITLFLPARLLSQNLTGYLL